MHGELMARGKKLEDLTTLRMALVGYQVEKQKIEARIAEIQAQLAGKVVASPAAAAEKTAAPKRILSAAARKRIAQAQKKRWAEHRRRMAAAAKA
jgi:cell division septum initiation protein DivIVA